MIAARERGRMIRAKYPWIKHLSRLLAVVMLLAAGWFAATRNLLAVVLFFICPIISMVIYIKVNRLEAPEK